MISSNISCGGGDDLCTDTVLFCKEFDHLPTVYFSFSIVSFICCIVVFLTFGLFRRLSGFSSNIFLYRTSLDFLIAIGHIVSYFSRLHEEKIGCGVLGVLFEFALFGTNLWYSVLAYDLIKAIRNPFGSRGGSVWRFHVVVWLLSLSAVIFLLISISSSVGPGISMFYLCWISVDTTIGKFAGWSLVLYYLPHLLLWLFSFFVNIVALWTIFNRFPASSETRRHVLKQNTVYVLILGFETIIIFPLWIAQLIISRNGFCFFDTGSLVIAFIFAVIHSLRGTIDLLVWWLTFSIGPKDFKHLYMRLKAWRRASLYLPQNTLNTPLVRMDDGEGVNKILRRDVMYCINYGILDAVRLNAEEESQRTKLGSVRDSFMAHVMVKWGEDNYQQETQQLYSDPLYQEVHKRRIPFQPSNNLRDFAFIDVEPTVFGMLRNSYGISPQLYQHSFRIKDEQDVESSGMLEKFTEGKSGSFFYFTRDFRFIIKTVTSKEEAFLQKIAYKYYNYMHNNPDSVIVRLYGLHKVRLAREQHYISVVVMDNIFYSDEKIKIHERYDLKGSTVGRKVLKGNESLQQKFKKTLKDLDLTSRVIIGSEAKAQLMEQLKADVDFLSSLQIMDYSMLLGIHHHTKDGSIHQRSMPIEVDGGDEFTFVNVGQQTSYNGLDSTTSSPSSTLARGQALAQRRRTGSSVFNDDPLSSLNLEDDSSEERTPYIPWFRRDYGGLKSQSLHHPLNSEIHNESMSFSVPEGVDIHTIPCDTYYFGIVDILQLYNFSKKIEHFTKTKVLKKDKNGISAVDEKTYATRFLEAMDRILE